MVSFKVASQLLITLILSSMPVFSFAADQCRSIFSENDINKVGGQFLHKKNPTLHTSNFVEQIVKKIFKQTQSRITTPADKVTAWLNYMEQAYQKRNSDTKALNNIKGAYLKKYLTKYEDVPEEYYQNQLRIAREQGHGTMTLTESNRKDLAETVIRDQRLSLEQWMDYFISNDSSSYPMWTKYWVFNGLVKLGKFNSETGSFSGRSTGQVAPFPELNREALALVIDGVIKKANKKSLDEINDPQFLSLLDGTNFGKLYGRALILASSQKHDLSVTSGRWIKYDQGSPPHDLVNSLTGMNTGWCTAGESTAQSQLKKGDFYVYYSNNNMNMAKVPRIAIRMEANKIVEVRGIAKDQNLDPQIAETSILNEKLTDFGSEADVYKTKTAHMKLLTELEKKHINKIEFTKEDVRFLYEIDGQIQGFGYEKDPRIAEILKHRNQRKEIAEILGLKEDEVSFTKEEVLRGGIKYHYGDLDFRHLRSAVGIVFPKIVSGGLDLFSLQSADGLILPKVVGGSLNLGNIESAEGLILPQTIGGDLNLEFLESAKGLTFSRVVGGKLKLTSLKSAQGLLLPASGAILFGR